MSVYNLTSSSSDSIESSVGDSMSILDFQSLINYALVDMQNLYLVNIEPQALPLLVQIAETESQVPILFEQLANYIPYQHPCAFSLINVLVNCLPLPESSIRNRLNETLCAALESNEASLAIQLNICYIWAVLSRKLAGRFAIDMFTIRIQSLLSKLLRSGPNIQIRLAAILAIESFAQTNENKLVISRNREILDEFEKLCRDSKQMSIASEREEDACYRQIECITEWSLDNRYGYQNISDSFTDLPNLYNGSNIVLNRFDCSPGVKVSRNGLVIRNDTGFFESIRATFACVQGATYYEVKMNTKGISQIGWATKDVSFSPEEGSGVGDDGQSFAFDGSRRRLWHQGEPTPYYAQELKWKEHDIVGCFLDMTHGILLFFLNGITIEPVFYIDEEKTRDFQERGGLFPALSLLTHQQVSVNFGQRPFAHAKSVDEFVQRIWREREEELTGTEILWRPLNSYPDARVPEVIKSFVPKMIKRTENDNSIGSVPKNNSQSSLQGLDDINLCHICFDGKRAIMFRPCGHSQFCKSCAKRMEVCPLCRTKIEEIRSLAEIRSSPPVSEL